MKAFGLGLMFGFLITIPAITGYKLGVVMMKQAAVESGSAYWCIEDHEKVFSWEKCE